MKTEKEIKERFNELVNKIDDMAKGFDDLKEKGLSSGTESFAGQIKGLSVISEANTLAWILDMDDKKIKDNREKMEELLIKTARSIKSLDEKDIGEYSDLMEEAKEIKKALNLESIDTALLILIYQTLDQIRFYNSD